MFIKPLKKLQILSCIATATVNSKTIPEKSLGSFNFSSTNKIKPAANCIDKTKIRTCSGENSFQAKSKKPKNSDVRFWYSNFGSFNTHRRDEQLDYNINENLHGKSGNFSSCPSFYNNDQVKKWTFRAGNADKRLKLEFTKIDIEESECKFFDPDSHPERGTTEGFSEFEGWEDCCLNDFMLVVVDGMFQGRYCGEGAGGVFADSCRDKTHEKLKTTAENRYFYEVDQTVRHESKEIRLDLAITRDSPVSADKEFMYGSFFPENRPSLKFPCRASENVGISEELPWFEGEELILILVSDEEDRFGGFSFDWSFVGELGRNVL